MANTTRIEEAYRAGSNGESMYLDTDTVKDSYRRGLTDFLNSLNQLGLKGLRSFVDLDDLIRPEAITGFITSLRAAGELALDQEGFYTSPGSISKDELQRQMKAAQIIVSARLGSSSGFTAGVIAAEAYATRKTETLEETMPEYLKKNLKCFEGTYGINFSLN